MTHQSSSVVMLVGEDIPDEAIEATNWRLRHLGYPPPLAYRCNVATVLEDIQLCADDADHEISSDARLAYQSATGLNYDRLRYFLVRERDINESFRMPPGARHTFVWDGNQVTLWQPVAA